MLRKTVAAVKPPSAEKRASLVEKREARSTGRYPFLTWTNKYLKNSGLAEATLKERERRLRRIYQDLQQLLSEGKIDTASPSKMAEKEVGAFVDLITNRGLRGKAFEHEITALNALLKYAKNTALEVYKVQHANQFRKCTKTSRLPSLSTEEYGRILQGTKEVDTDHWYQVEAYAIVILSLASGARHKELKEGKIWDLCLEGGKESYHIDHPKGEDTYGETRDPPIRPECLPFLRKYLEMRKKQLVKRPDNEFLFPALRDKIDGKLSSNSITRMVRIVGKQTHVIKLDLHKCRRTYGQMLLDEGMSIEEVSVLMGHASTAMTEKFYCRRKQQQATDSARNLWGNNVPNPTPKPSPAVNSPLIDKKPWDTGYIM